MRHLIGPLIMIHPVYYMKTITYIGRISIQNTVVQGVQTKSHPRVCPEKYDHNFKSWNVPRFYEQR